MSGECRECSYSARRRAGQMDKAGPSTIVSIANFYRSSRCESLMSFSERVCSRESIRSGKRVAIGKQRTISHDSKRLLPVVVDSRCPCAGMLSSNRRSATRGIRSWDNLDAKVVTRSVRGATYTRGSVSLGHADIATTSKYLAKTTIPAKAVDQLFADVTS